MSKELSSYYGIVGSRDYVRNLNSQGEFSVIVRDKDKYNYYDIIKELTTRIDKAVDEIYEDLSYKYKPNIIRYIPSDKRKKVIDIITDLCEIAKPINYSFNKLRDIISILELRSSYGGFNDYNLDKSFDVLKRGGSDNISGFGITSLLSRAIDYGASYAAGDNEKDQKFLYELSCNSSYPEKEYLQALLTRYEYTENPSNFKRKNGKELCSDDYLEYYIKEIFDKSFSLSTRFSHEVTAFIGGILQTIDKDLDIGISNKDYVTDENVTTLVNICKEFEKLGGSHIRIIEKISKLAWYVGGDGTKIGQLQKNLNVLGITGDNGRLLEDGVYGRETFAAWHKFIDKLINGSTPMLVWGDPLQTSLTGIKTGLKTTLNNIDYPILLSTKNKTPLFGADLHGYAIPGTKSKIEQYYHINVKTIPDDTLFHQNIASKLNHIQISEKAYNILINFENIARKVRIAGRVFLIAGIVLDTLELGFSVYDDLHDVDKKLGKKTISTAVQIGGRWVGALAGAKLGSMGGATLGTAILPGLGTVIGGFTGGLV